MSHLCHAIGCAVPVPPEMLMCKVHWLCVPKYIRDAVWATYRDGQCDDMNPSNAWHVAADHAITFVAVVEGRLTKQQGDERIRRSIERHGVNPIREPKHVSRRLPARSSSSSSSGRLVPTAVELESGLARPADSPTAPAYGGHESSAYVVNLRHKLAVTHVYIGRGSIYGNPWSHRPSYNDKAIRVSSREQAISNYREWLTTDLEIDGWKKPTRDEILALDGQALACYCDPLPCHGTVLIDLIRQYKLPETRYEPGGLRPFMKWPGGKSWLVDRLVPEIMATKPSIYVEPFLGAGAIALALPRRIPMILNDACASLMNVWEHVKERPLSLGKEAARVWLKHGNHKDGYLEARDLFNSGELCSLFCAAYVLYLNKHCFNGLWRENSDGKFNVPFGDMSDPKPPTENELVLISNHLVGADLHCADFEAMFASAGVGTAVFADPPYDQGFTQYTPDGFDEAEQRRLALALQRAAGCGANIWTTNADTPLIRDIYSWASIETIEETRSIGSKAERRKAASCLLIRG